jgi:DNA-directed RNA polymerase subunit K/omega
MSETIRLKPQTKNAFEFVTVASARARQLLEGCTPRVEGSAKPARRALQEVARGAVAPVDPSDPAGE